MAPIFNTNFQCFFCTHTSLEKASFSDSV